MTICGQQFNEELLGRIGQLLVEEPGLSRTALSRRVCQWLDWCSPSGRLKQVSCRVALLRLHRQGRIQLPPAQVWARRRRRVKPKGALPRPVRAGLSEIGPVELVRVGRGGSRSSQVWNELMQQYHPLGAGPLCGAQLRYLIRSEKYGWLGGLAFSAAAWRVRARDSWIGWTEAARRENLQRVVANSRFLILPQVRVQHLASHVLGQALKRLGADWQQRYGYRPWLVETYVGQRYRGTSYRAANWVAVGSTAGRGRQDSNRRRVVALKQVYVYRLHRQARRRLCQSSRAPVPQAAPLPADWAEEEFGAARLGDRRLTQRLLVLARDFFARPQAPLPQACQSWARTKAAYRFCDHQETDMQTVLQPHYQATWQRLQPQRLVLAVQDTTTLNYTAHPATEELGPISSQAEGAQGLLLHSTLAFTLEGTPLGLLDTQCWARNGAEFGKKHQRKKRSVEDKESHKWLASFRAVAQAQPHCPHTTLVSVGDREADVYELFQLAQADARGPRLLIRAQQDRLLEEGQQHLWDSIRHQPPAGTQLLEVPRRANRPARQARLEVRFAPVTLHPPQRPGLEPVALWAVLAEETGVPAGVEPLCWLLLTTCPVENFPQACQKLRWYSVRWKIEIYHRTLKSGCRIEQRQLGSADRLETCLAIDLVVAWRVFHLAMQGRETPDLPCTVFFEDAQWKALTAYFHHDPVPPATPPNLRQAMRLVARLGGFLARKGDGEPGTQTLWLGLQRLDDLTAMYLLMTRSPPPPVANRRYG